LVLPVLCTVASLFGGAATNVLLRHEPTADAAPATQDVQDLVKAKRAALGRLSA